MPFDHERFDTARLERLAQLVQNRQRDTRADEVLRQYEDGGIRALHDFAREERENSTESEYRNHPRLPHGALKLAVDILTLNDAAFSYSGEPGDFLFTKMIFQAPSHLRGIEASDKSTLLNLIGEVIPAWPVSRFFTAAVKSSQWEDVLAPFTIGRSHVLLLDEPTNHLDPSPFDLLARSINEYEGPVVIVSHDANRCARLAGDGAAVIDLDESIERTSVDLSARLKRGCVCVVSRDFRPVLYAVSEAVKCLRDADERAAREGVLGSRIELPWPERAKWLANKVNQS